MNFPTTLDDIRADYPDAPPHVPKDRIVDISFASGGVPNDLVDPYEPFQWLNGPGIPHLLFNKPVIITLQGGKGSDFSAAPVGFTSVSGSLKISNGRLNADHLKIKP